MMDATTRAARTRGPSPLPLVGGTLIALVTAACTIEVGPAETVTPDAPVVPTRTVAVVQESSVPQPYSDLRPDEQTIVDLFEGTSPSVVYISTLTRRADIFGRTEIVPGGSGTGFIWDDQGHIVTNYHVIQGADQARVVMHDQTGYLATWVGGSARHDLAVLRIEAPPDILQGVALGDSDRLRVGQNVYAIGNPFGLSATLTTGVISALNRQIEALNGDLIEDVIQIDAAINPGNSGGPLLDSRGRVIGVNSQILTLSGTSAGLGFAVPVNIVLRVVPQLIATGEYTAARLGVTSFSSRVNQNVSRSQGVTGVLINQVIPGFGAAEAGLQGTNPRASLLGDIITEVDGDAVQTWRDLRRVLDRYQSGDEVELAVSRDGEMRTVVATLR
ncbi:MAG: trypsin-like peptidase domain-containing protein [Acidobacteriota bacterium]|nr:trypsin-like peptidase domain-containing protein [Acidobacteriota bacterium]